MATVFQMLDELMTVTLVLGVAIDFCSSQEHDAVNVNTAHKL